MNAINVIHRAESCALPFAEKNNRPTTLATRRLIAITAFVLTALMMIWPSTNANALPVPIVAAYAGQGNDRLIVTEDQVWVTQDGGANWLDATPKVGVYRFAAVDFGRRDEANPIVSLLGVDVNESSTYRLLRSFDGGKNWLRAGELPNIDSGKQHSMCFSSESHGWLLVQDATTANFSQAKLYRTIDGGQSWFVLPAPPAAGRVLFTNTDRGYLVGGVGSSQLFTTDDAGASWQLAQLPGMVSQVGVTALSALNLSANGDVSIKATHQLNSGKVIQHFSLSINGRWQLVSSRNAAAASSNNLQSIVESAASEAKRSLGETTIEVVNNEVFEVRDGAARVMSLPASLRDVMPQTANATNAKAVVQTTTRGFDVCEAPTVAQMQNWKTNSPYAWTIIYLGGNQRACPQAQLNSTWVNQLFAQGWRVVPTWVGPQSPTTTCAGCSSRISTNATTARQQGRDQAVLAAAAAANIGLPVPSIIYYDMERYTSHTAAEEQFISGWVEELRARGHQSGLYTNQNFIPDFEALALKPDAVWIARWFTTRPATLPSADAIPNTANTVYTGKRLWQYLGDVSVTYGGLTFGIDENVSNGPTTAPGTPPAVPNGLAPGNTVSPGPTLSSLSPTLTWSAVSGATQYSIAVRDLSTNTLIVDTTVTTNSYAASLVAGRGYRWAVSACNSSGCSSSAAPLYFTTPAAVNGACGSANGGIVDVKPVANLCTAGTASSVTGVGGWTWTCAGGLGGSNASCSAEFTGNVAPDVPTTLAPGGATSPGTLLNSKTVKLTWSAMPRAAKYGVAVRDMTTNTLVTDTTVTTNSYTATLLANRIYRWNVDACTVNNVCSAYSGRLYFKTSN
jgi:Domain of unknown function (DUF1906)